MSKADDKSAIVAKYRATPRCKHALKIIAPDPERQRECEDDVATALWGPWNTKYGEARIRGSGSQKNYNAISRKLNKRSSGPANALGKDHQGLAGRAFRFESGTPHHH